MDDLGNIFGGLTFTESDLGDGAYGESKLPGLFGKKGKARRKIRRKKRQARRADRKAALTATGMTLKELQEALKKARIDRKMERIRARKKAGLTVSAKKARRLAAAQGRKAQALKGAPRACPPSLEGQIKVVKVGSKKVKFACLKGKMLPLASLPPEHQKALLKQARQKKITKTSSAAQQVAGTLPISTAAAFATVQDTAAYDTNAAAAYTAATDMYDSPASYQEEAYQAEAYDAGQAYTEGGMTDYWEGGGTAVSSYAPAAATGAEEYADEEYEEEGGSALPLILGGVAVLALGGVGFYIYKKKKAGAEEPDFAETPDFSETLDSEGA